ncbi:MAG: PAS domain-containing protein, partial [Victivallales bacterium]|nr:PAS domain-containing protein [Victivallales bacterium]
MSTMLLTVAALSLIISVSVYYFAKEVQLSNIDKKLLRWANYSKTTLPDNFHDRIVNKTTVSKKQFDKIVARNNQRCLEMDLQYLWSVLVLDPDTIVFTTSTSPLKDISQNDYAEFFEVHSDPEAFETALKAMKPVFSTFHNKWGYGRMVLVPEYDSKGRVFMFGASVSIDSILAKQKKIAFSALGISFGILLLGFIYSLLLSSFFSKPIVKLSNMADYISRGHFDCTLELKGANELVKLSRTINKMTMTIKKNIQELKESELEGKQYKRMLDYTEDGIFSYKLKDGQILNANRGFIKIFDLNCDPEDLAGKNINEQFFNIENTDLVNETIKKEKRVHNYELHFKTLKGEVRWVVYDSFVVTNKDTHEQIAEAKIRDITAQKKLENEKNTTLKFLNLINKSRSLKELISFAADFIQEESGCGAIGIRLKKDEDYPYFEYRGFADEFILIENSLCSKNGEGEIKRDLKGNPVLECMCGNVICGRFDPSKPFFTKNGSFWSNCIAELPDSTIEENRKANMRNRCKGEQYNSIALIPLTTGNKIFGLLQLNDIRKGMFTLEKITLYENLSGYLGVAAAKFEAEEELEKYRDHLEKLIAERTEQLNKQKERLLLAEQIAHVGSFEWNIRTNSFHMTPELKRIYGIEAEECKETREAWEKLIYPHDRAYVNNLTEQLFQTGAQAEGEWRITRADGNIRWILGRFEIFRDESGRPLFLSGVNFDIT